MVGAQESEEVLRQNALLREAWGDTAVPGCESIADTNHFSVLHERADPEGRLHRLAVDLL